MDENDFLKLIKQILNLKTSYIEIKTDNLYIKALKTDCNKSFNNKIRTKDRICCTKAEPNVVHVKSLYVGVISIFNKKTNDTYVKVGNKVKKNQILGFINYLKINIDVLSPIDGIVTKVFIRNNDIVEYGQALFEIIEN